MDSIRPKLSIITVCFNEVERIRSTLDSISDQSFKSFELIVVDGGSTDGTVEILDEYSQMIDDISSGPDNGIYDAMNKGIDRANGEYVFFLNGGDRLHDKQSLALLFSESKNREIIYGDVCFIDTDGNRVIRNSPQELSAMFLTFNMLCHQAWACKLELLRSLNNLDTDYKIAADYDLLLKAVFWSQASSCKTSAVVADHYLDGVSRADENLSTLRSERFQIQKKVLPRYWYIASRLHYWLLIHKDFIPKGKITRRFNSWFESSIGHDERRL